MKRLAPLLLAAATAGCAVGPHYRAPVDTAVSAARFRTTGPGLDPAGELPARWWSLYADPALDALVAEALTHNSDLRVAAANIERAQAVLREQRAALLPTTQVTAAVVRGRGGASSGTSGTNAGAGGTGNPGTGGTGGGTGTGAGTTVGNTGGSAGGGAVISPPSTGGVTETIYRAGATLSYEVDLFGRVRRSIEAASADVAAARETRDATRVTVAAATTQAYLDACSLGRQLDVANASLQLAAQSYAITERQLRLGATSPYELSRVGVLVEQTRSAIPQIEGQRAAALYDLTTLLGRPANQVPDVAAACHAVPQLGRPLPVGDGAALIRRRPDIRAAERTLAADVARVGVATAELFPTITLGGAINASGTGLRSATSRSGVAFGFGPLISWFFPNILAARARVQQAGADARASLARFDGTVLTALGEAEKALAYYDAELRRNVALGAAQAQAARAYQLSGVRVRYGTLSQLEQLDVQRDLISTQAALAASATTLAQYQVAVFRTLGGGWQEAPAIDPAPTAVTGTGGVKLKRPVE